MDKLACINAFVEVVKNQGFTPAAKKLGVSKAVVSRQVAQLESSLDLCLLHRSTRQVSATTAGLDYYDRCLPLLADFQALDDAMQDRQQAPAGELRISAPSSSFSQRYLTPTLKEFAAAYPDVQLDIELTDDMIDVIELRCDLAIRIGSLPDSSLIAKKLAAMEVYLCASPAYLNRHGAPQHPDELQQHPLIIDSNYRDGLNWNFQCNDESITLPVAGPIRINCAAMTCDLLHEGLGLGLCPSFIADEAIAKGDLIRILPNWSIYQGGIYAVYSHRKYLSNNVRLFVQMLQNALRKLDAG